MTQGAASTHKQDWTKKKWVNCFFDVCCSCFLLILSASNRPFPPVHKHKPAQAAKQCFKIIWQKHASVCTWFPSDWTHTHGVCLQEPFICVKCYCDNSFQGVPSCTFMVCWRVCVWVDFRPAAGRWGHLRCHTHSSQGFLFLQKETHLAVVTLNYRKVCECVLRSDTRDACRAECVITLRSTFSEAGLLFRQSR